MSLSYGRVRRVEVGLSNVNSSGSLDPTPGNSISIVQLEDAITHVKSSVPLSPIVVDCRAVFVVGMINL